MKINSILLLAIFISANSFAQLNSALPEIHSHNDYLQQEPLFGALYAGAKSIEIDLHLKNDSLFVAHSKREIKSINTLESLYILPLKEYLAENTPKHKFHLMIDIKSEPISTLKALQKTLIKYPRIFSTEGIQLVISGNRPKPEAYKNYAEFICFDARSPDEIVGEESKRMAMISQNIWKFTQWRGHGDIPEKDKLELVKFIKESHRKNKPVRLWNSGDNEKMYQFLCKIGVDYINTDNPKALRSYLNTLEIPNKKD